MRIVSGIHRGRTLIVPKDNAIRPTSDKVRGAVFNALRSRGAVEGAHVMDCFCGTGALGFEAISQGAASCLFIDNARDSLDLARENAEALKVGAEFMLKDATKIYTRPADKNPAALVFLDPPYNKNLVPAALSALAENNWLAPGAILVTEMEKSARLIMPPGFKILDEKIYGDTKIQFLSAPV